LEIAMDVYIPYRPENPKTRLSSHLDRDERKSFSRAMLRDVADIVHAVGHRPVVLSTSDIDVGLDTVVSPAPLSDAVNDVLPGEIGDGDALDLLPRTDSGTKEMVGVIMADLALATPDALTRLFGPDADVVIAPGRRGGTNALVSCHPDFRVDYHGVSYRDHRRIAAERDITVVTVDSFRLSTDVDEPADIVEVLLHGTGQAHEYLESLFDVVVESDGEVGIART
jgi:2-phospho-L-lactate guanylyltransferase